MKTPYQSLIVESFQPNVFKGHIRTYRLKGKNEQSGNHLANI